MFSNQTFLWIVNKKKKSCKPSDIKQIDVTKKWNKTNIFVDIVIEIRCIVNAQLYIIIEIWISLNMRREKGSNNIM